MPSEIAYDDLEQVKVGDVFLRWEGRGIWVMSTSGKWVEAEIGHPYPNPRSILRAYYLNVIWHMDQTAQVSWILKQKKAQ